MSSYTPTTDNVRHLYVEGASGPDFDPLFPEAWEDEFDRWLTDVKAQAWDEGQKSGLRFADRAIKAHDIERPDLPGPPSPNPYRTDSEATS